MSSTTINIFATLIAAPGNEAYKDQAAVDAHMQSPHFQAALGEAGPLLGGPPSIAATRQIA